MPGNPDKAMARRKSGDLARNRSTEDQKEHTDFVSSPEGRMRQPYRGGGGEGGCNSAGLTGTEKFLRNIERSMIERANQVPLGKT